MTSVPDLTRDPRQDEAATRLSDTRLDAFRPLVRRRVLVIVTLGVYLSAVASLATDRLAPALATLALMALSLAMLWVLRRVVRAMADLPSAYIDERIEHVRNLAHKRAFTLFAGLTMLGALLVGLAGELRDAPLPLTADHALAAFWALMLLSASLPSMVLAWTEPEI